MDTTTTTVSPLKRRAVLSSLDVNAMPHIISSPTTLKNKMADGHVPSVAAQGKKRVSMGDSPAAKKTCLSDSTGAVRSRTNSPDMSSVFDNGSEASAEDASWATNATEPSDAGLVPVVNTVERRAGGLTREQARERAEIIRLRLGLASYKLRTGQVSVPLADLQAKPLPRHNMRPPSGSSLITPSQEDEKIQSSQSSQSDSIDQDDPHKMLST